MSVAVEEEEEVVKDDTWYKAKSMFSTVDEDGSGNLDREEVRKCLSLLGMPIVESELDAAMRAMDEDGSEEVDFDEFFAWWKGVQEREEAGAACWDEEEETSEDGSETDDEALVPVPPGAPPARGGRRVATGPGGSPPAPPGAPPKRGSARKGKRPVAPLKLDEPSSAESTKRATEQKSPTATPRAGNPLLTKCCWWRKPKKTPRQECRELFDEVDDDGSGLLDVGEIVKLAKLLGVDLSPAQCKEAMDEMDDDSSGEVDFEEFYMWFKKTSGPDGEGRGHCDTDIGKATMKWAQQESHRSFLRSSEARSRSVLHHASTGMRTVEEMKKSHGHAREKAHSSVWAHQDPYSGLTLWGRKMEHGPDGPTW